jgi:protein-disulfide isomerase
MLLKSSGRLDRLKQVLQTAAMCMVLVSSGSVFAQTAPAGTPSKPAAPAADKAPSLQLHSLAPDTMADPFPPVNPKFFTADSPSVSTVDSYLHAVLGYDSARIWRVVAIQKTQAVGVSKVTALVSERAPNAKVQQAAFFVLADGKHLIADTSGVQNFGADPYAASRALLKAQVNGPSHGATSKDLMLVEFADLQCPHCKEAQPTMKQLAEDFPQARIVYQSLPLVDIHPFAEKAALYGACVAKKSNDTFFTYAQAVYDTQSQLTPEAGEQTLKAAVTKAGADPVAIAACAATPEAKSEVAASVKLADELGVEQTPILMVNGRMIPLGGLPYETLKQVIIFQAGLDGVTLPAATLVK